MLHHLRELFIFTRQEKRGLFVLLFLIGVVSVINLTMPLFLHPKVSDMSVWETEVAKLMATAEEGSNQNDLVEFHFVPFDPNQINSEQLVAMGIPAKIASNWEKYLQKGGRFNEETALAKLYGMTPELLKTLSPYLLFTESAKNRPAVQKGPASLAEDRRSETMAQGKPRKVVEANLADSAALEAIPGIGPKLASRIVKFRRLLGGFHNVDQISQVYGMSSENFGMARSYLTVDSLLIEPVSINFASVEQMGKHPYIRFKAARKIVNVRDQSGPFHSLGDLTQFFSPDTLRLLRPYLLFSE